jgi:iron-sulfur cluster repair protein YtfE (RIC family)
MDTLINLSEAHKKISEMPVMYQKILTTVNFYNVVEYVKSLNKLFRDTVLPHFDFEEKKIFPVILSKGEVGFQSLISALQQEHKEITGELAQLNELSAKLESNPNATQKEKDKLATLCSEITRELTEHAQKEDERLFPYLRNISFNDK